MLGPTAEWTRLDAGRGSTRVFGVGDVDGGAWIVKQYRAMRGFEQERRALAQWFARRTHLGGARVPQLRAADADLAALIIERLPGDSVEALGPGEALAHAAGRFLAALHELAVADDDPLAVAEALMRRTRAWLRRGALEPELARIVAEHGPRPELFAGVHRVPCHRDFAPRNWLWDGRRLAVIDFEHARLDVGLGDLAKLHVDSWSRQPGLATAFFCGYGRTLSDLERERLRALIVLHGVASLMWGREHQEPGGPQPSHVAEGLRALELGARGLLP